MTIQPSCVVSSKRCLASLLMTSIQLFQPRLSQSTVHPLAIYYRLEIRPDPAPVLWVVVVCSTSWVALKDTMLPTLRSLPPITQRFEKGGTCDRAMLVLLVVPTLLIM